MTANEELNKALYDKMSAEMERYRKELLSMPPDEILKNAYEYAVREDILLTMENYDLDDERARALLDSETPLSDAFQAVEGENIGYTDMIQRWACSQTSEKRRHDGSKCGILVMEKPQCTQKGARHVLQFLSYQLCGLV